MHMGGEGKSDAAVEYGRADDELLLKKLEKKVNLMETLPAAQRP